MSGREMLTGRLGRLALRALLPILVIAIGPAGAIGQDAASRNAAVLDLINRERLAHGLTAVEIETRLTGAAQAHAEAMAASGQLSHDTASGGSLESRLQAVGYAYLRVVENIASGQPTAEMVVADWMASTGHRGNLLNPEVTQLGVGYGFRTGDRYQHYWTVLLARPTVSAAAAIGGAGAVSDAVLAEVNRVRQVNGLPTVRASYQLAEAARRHTRYMLDSGQVGHDGPNGQTVADRVLAAGYEYRFVAENVAAGQEDAVEVVNAWMNSPGHRANLLDPTVTEIGSGYEFRASDPYRHYWTLVLAAPL